jgi:hypothetical protein
VPYALLVWRFWFVTDDAFISFRYARNLVLGYGLRYNPGEHPPVEGYSNFLWVLLCAVFEHFRMDVTFWPLLVSAACGTALLWLLFDVLHRRLGVNLVVASLATLSVGCFPPFAVWSTSGLATVPFALLVLVTFERLVLRRAGPDGIGGGVAGLLLALIRLEGIAWVLVILVLAIVAGLLTGQRRFRSFLPFLLIVGLGYAAYFGWRYAYYDVLLPNTAQVKGDLDAANLSRGVNYVVMYALTFLTPALIVPGSVVALRRKRVAVGLPVAAMAWAFPVYAIVVTGDFMAMGRFLVPGFAFSAVLLAWMLEDLWGRTAFRRAGCVAAGLAVVALGLLPGWDWHVVPEATRVRFRFRFNTPPFKTEFEQWQSQARNAAEWAELGRALASYVQHRDLPDQHPSYVAGAIGAVGYYSDLYIYDRNGLVTPEIARREPPADATPRSPGHDKRVPHEYFLKDQPAILRATVVQGAGTRAVVGACRRWAYALRRGAARLRLDQRYVPDFAELPETGQAGLPRYVVTCTRIPEGSDPGAAWADFEDRLRALQSTGRLSEPR